MKLAIIFSLLLFTSCAAVKVFSPHNTCSPGALHVYHESIAHGNRPIIPTEIKKFLLNRSDEMNQCFKQSASWGIGRDFETCMVVVFNENGRVEYQKISGPNVDDRQFYSCAKEALKNLPVSTNFKKVSVLQSYNFFID